MDKTKELLKEFESLVGSAKHEDQKRMDEIIKQLEATDSPEQRKLVDGMVGRVLEQVDANLQEISQEILRDRIDDKAYKLIPWKYVAEEYFGKSAAWLSQRINGTPVRGKVYTLNAEQKETLNRALSEIARYIGSYRFA